MVRKMDKSASMAGLSHKSYEPKVIRDGNGYSDTILSERAVLLHAWP